jgi:hypothetical protein
MEATAVRLAEMILVTDVGAVSESAGPRMRNTMYDESSTATKNRVDDKDTNRAANRVLAS